MLRSSRSCRAAAKAVSISAAAPTRATTTKPTKAGDRPSFVEAASSVPTKISLTSATKTVVIPSTMSASRSGQASSATAPWATPLYWALWV